MIKLLKNKEAAMFGLDARIALAIFGALSIITGASLYSAIQAAKTEQWHQNFESILKATEAYYLDIRKPLTIFSTLWDYTYTSDLITNRQSLPNWRGPYISGTPSVNGTFQNSASKTFNKDAHFLIFLKQKSKWTANTSYADEKCIADDLDCIEWISLYSGGSSSDLLELFNELDKKIDKGDGQLAGSVRYNTYSNGYLFYQGMPRRR